MDERKPAAKKKGPSRKRKESKSRYVNPNQLSSPFRNSNKAGAVDPESAVDPVSAAELDPEAAEVQAAAVKAAKQEDFYAAYVDILQGMKKPYEDLTLFKAEMERGHQAAVAFVETLLGTNIPEDSSPYDVFFNLIMKGDMPGNICPYVPVPRG
jgi:hypothetical protein